MHFNVKCDDWVMGESKIRKDGILALNEFYFLGEIKAMKILVN